MEKQYSAETGEGNLEVFSEDFGKNFFSYIFSWKELENNRRNQNNFHLTLPSNISILLDVHLLLPHLLD